MPEDYVVFSSVVGYVVRYRELHEQDAFLARVYFGCIHPYPETGTNETMDSSATSLTSTRLSSGTAGPRSWPVTWPRMLTAGHSARRPEFDQTGLCRI
jgi:hypothetical protein